MLSGEVENLIQVMVQYGPMKRRNYLTEVTVLVFIHRKRPRGRQLETQFITNPRIRENTLMVCKLVKGYKHVSNANGEYLFPTDHDIADRVLRELKALKFDK